MEGRLTEVKKAIAENPEFLSALLPIVANPEASINVRLGASVIFEGLPASPALKALVPQLGELAGHADARVRADACFFLGLSGDARGIAYLEPRLKDADAEVREIAADSLEELTAAQG
jgi:HEAT repeat protein